MSKQFVPKRAMFVFSHPDDIEFVSGGTAILWANSGCHLIFVLATDGNVGSHDPDMTTEKLIQLRRSEQRQAADLVGAKECVFLGRQDGLLEPDLSLRRDIVELIRSLKPDALVTTDPTNLFPNTNYINHPDHRATAIAAIDAAYAGAAMPLLYPEMKAKGLNSHCIDHLFVQNDEQANFYVDISEVMEQKIAAIKKHESQFTSWDPAEAVYQWNAGTGKKVGLPYVEAYRHITLCNRSPYPD